MIPFHTFRCTLHVSTVVMDYTKYFSNWKELPEKYSANQILLPSLVHTRVTRGQPLSTLTFWHHSLCHPGPRIGGNGVTVNVALPAFNCQSVAEAQNAQLCSTIICLAEVAIYARSWGSHDDPKRKQPQHHLSRGLLTLTPNLIPDAVESVKGNSTNHPSLLTALVPIVTVMLIEMWCFQTQLQDLSA